MIRTDNVRDSVITRLGPTREWTTGEHRSVLEFDSAPRKRLIDVRADSDRDIVAGRQPTAAGLGPLGAG